MHCYQIALFIAGTISILGLIGNGITFCTFGKICNQNASIVLFRALACVDSFLLITRTLYQTLIMSHSGDFWMYAAETYIVEPLGEIALTATVWTILLVGVHRYIVVCKPLLAARLCTVGNARRHFCGVILLVIAINFPLFFPYRVIEQTITSNSTDHSGTQVYKVCTNMVLSPWFNVLYDFAFLNVIINYAIPVGSLIFITVRLCQSLRSLQQLRTELREEQRHAQRDIRTECMVIVVLIVFLLSHTSLPIFLALHKTGKLEMVNTVDTPFCKSMYFSVWMISDMLVLLNSSVNIIIYIAFNRNFRRALFTRLRPVTIRPNEQQHWRIEYHPRIKVSKRHHAGVIVVSLFLICTTLYS